MEGIIKAGDSNGGRITTASGTEYDYVIAAVVPPSPPARWPKKNEAVCFVPDQSQSGVAKSVRIGTCAVVNHAKALEATFIAAIDQPGAAALNAEILTEVQRLAYDRATRIENGKQLPPEVVAARLELAVATMKLMAVEANATGLDSASEKSLRAILRRQRPPLPR